MSKTNRYDPDDGFGYVRGIKHTTKRKARVLKEKQKRDILEGRDERIERKNSGKKQRVHYL
jgi:hypothetical protein